MWSNRFEAEWHIFQLTQPYDNGQMRGTSDCAICIWLTRPLWHSRFSLTMQICSLVKLMSSRRRWLGASLSTSFSWAWSSSPRATSSCCSSSAMSRWHVSCSGATASSVQWAVLRRRSEAAGVTTDLSGQPASAPVLSTTTCRQLGSPGSVLFSSPCGAFPLHTDVQPRVALSDTWLLQGHRLLSSATASMHKFLKEFERKTRPQFAFVHFRQHSLQAVQRIRIKWPTIGCR